MHTFRNILCTAALTLFAFVTVTYTACKDACKDVTCLNGGACKKGECVCPFGYTGDRCEEYGSFVGDTPDPCTGIVCQNGGKCVTGKCVCPPGYDGAKCELLSKDQLKGVWTVEEDGTASMPAFYDVVVEYGASNADMLIKNFYNKFSKTIAIKLSHDSLFIPVQTVDGYEIKGHGRRIPSPNYNGKPTVTLWYSVKAPGGQVDDFGLASGQPATWNR